MGLSGMEWGEIEWDEFEWVGVEWNGFFFFNNKMLILALGKVAGPSSSFQDS